MRTFKVSDELYEQLKSFVVDPFDDTPEAVIERLVEIVNKAKSRWSPFDPEVASQEPQQPPRPPEQTLPQTEEEVVLL